MFDETKFFLGRLCKRKHEYENTGKSLRRIRNSDCLECINGRARNIHLKNRYNITEQEYKEMYDAQNGLCAICGKPELIERRNGQIDKLSVDHDHLTGKIRSLLCGNCNRRLGLAKDNPVLGALDFYYLMGVPKEFISKIRIEGLKLFNELLEIRKG